MQPTCSPKTHNNYPVLYFTTEEDITPENRASAGSLPRGRVIERQLDAAQHSQGGASVTVGGNNTGNIVSFQHSSVTGKGLPSWSVDL